VRCCKRLTRVKKPWQGVVQHLTNRFIAFCLSSTFNYLLTCLVQALVFTRIRFNLG